MHIFFEKSKFFFQSRQAMTAVSLLKLFNILTGCCLALQMTQGKRNKESMEVVSCVYCPSVFYCMKAAALHLHSKGFFLKS